MGIIREEIFFATRSELRAWLAKNFDQATGVWAIFYKKSSGLSDMSWEVVVEECLCFGWIDSFPGKVDETKTKRYISPRKLNSGWSRRNKNLVIELESNGLMAAPGRAVIQRAKANGSWELFDLAEDLVIPAELQLLLNKDRKFSTAWNQLTESKRRQLLQKIYDAKTDKTRAARIQLVRNSIVS